jgi:site-specific DNA-methyltransferase (adenine-specific)
MTDNLPATSSWLFWDKGTGENDFADGELAWTSFGGALRKITKSWVGANAKDESDRIHPTQKPIYLYSWIYNRYLPQGGKVIDTHLGSGSNRIAANKAGNIDFTGFELDKDYYEAQEKRWKGFIAQTRLF